MKYRYRKYPGKSKGNTYSLKEAMGKVVNDMKMEARYHHAVIKTSWEQIAGPMINSKTTQLFVKKKTLFIGIDSAPLKNELNIRKQSLIRRINEYVGSEAVTDVRFL